MNLMSFFTDKDILVTGGCGSIGSEIVRQLIDHNPKRIRVFDHSENGHFLLNQKLNSPLIRNLLGDVRDRQRIMRAMDGVDFVFHASALKHVPFCEYNPYEAVHTNVIGTKNLVEAAIEKKVAGVVAISTDKAVGPVNTMGATKLLSEKIVTGAPVGQSETKFSCVRFGNVLDSDGSVVPIFRHQIEKGGPVTLTSESMTRFFMTIPQSVSLILHAALEMRGREIFVLKMYGMKISDLAQVMIEELAPTFGHKPEDIDIEIIGVRPGEKLYEALFTKMERPFVAENEHMFVIRSSPYDTYKPDDSAEFTNYNSANMILLSKDEVKDVLYREKIL
jgi:FlaA1/EpsC-like NDP-sugar epimerase